MGLKRRSKAGYGVADFGISGAELLLQLYLLDFYIRGVGLAPLLAGIALALAVLWDAVTDPLMGGILDQTHSRFGRFVPWLALGAVLLSSGLIALFNPPEAGSSAVHFCYLLGCFIWVNTGMTLLGVPHIAMGGVLSADTHERTELYGWRLVFGTLGLFAGILAPLLAAAIWHMDVAEISGFNRSRSAAGWLLGLLVLLTAAITIAAVWRRTRVLQSSAGRFSMRHLLGGVGGLLRNPVFVPFLAAFIFIAMGRAMNATLALPYYKDRLQLSEATIQGVILSTFTLCIVLAVPIWTWAGRRFGKRNPAFTGMLTLALMTLLAYPLFPSGSLPGPLLAAVLGGVAVAAIILIESLLTDIADADRASTGEDREGLYFGLWRMGQKIARSVTLGLSGLLLSMIGYQEALLEQTAETQHRLGVAFGVGPGLCFLIGSLLFLAVPIGRRP